MKLKNILRQEKFNKLNKILFFGLAVFFVIAAIVNKNWFLVFVAFCFAVVGFSPTGMISTPTKSERMQQVADEVDAVYNSDDDPDEDSKESDDNTISKADDSEDSE